MGTAYSSRREARKAYRQAALRFHPDAGGDLEAFLQATSTFETEMKKHRQQKEFWHDLGIVSLGLLAAFQLATLQAHQHDMSSLLLLAFFAATSSLWLQNNGGSNSLFDGRVDADECLLEPYKYVTLPELLSCVPPSVELDEWSPTMAWVDAHGRICGTTLEDFRASQGLDVEEVRALTLAEVTNLMWRGV